MIPSTPCADQEPCCVSMYDIAAHLLAEVYDAVLQCYPSGCCEPLAAYVSMSDGDDGIKDALTVAVSNVVLSPNSVPRGLSLSKATFSVRLRESGWPTAHVADGAIVLPPPDQQAVAARHVFSMGEAIHRRLTTLMRTGGLTPPGTRCSNATIGTLNPLNPQGGVTGWVVPVVIDLPWN